MAALQYCGEAVWGGHRFICSSGAEASLLGDQVEEFELSSAVWTPQGGAIVVCGDDGAVVCLRAPYVCGC